MTASQRKGEAADEAVVWAKRWTDPMIWACESLLKRENCVLQERVDHDRRDRTYDYSDNQLGDMPPRPINFEPARQDFTPVE